MPNIVQAEFFLVDLRVDSLNAVLREASERRKDGSPLKICLRFYDEDGRMLRFAQHAERLEAISKMIFERFVKARGVKRWWLDQKSRWNAGARMRLQARATVAAIKKAEQVVSDRFPAAIELGDHRYALIEGNERHEAIEAVRQAKKAWLFVYEPGRLCFDRNTLIASLM